MKNKQTKPNTTLLFWCCLLLIRKSWPYMFAEVVSSQLLLTHCCLQQQMYILLHTTSYCFLVSLSDDSCRNCPSSVAVWACSGWGTKLLSSFLILPSARTWQWLVGTDLLPCRSSPPWAPAEGFPFSLLCFVRDFNSHLTVFFLVEWRYSVQNRKKREGRTVTHEETQQKLWSKRISSVVSDVAAICEPAQPRRCMLLWRSWPEALS